MDKICVLILQYNSPDLTLNLLESIEKHENENLADYRIVVMDNASAEPKQDEIKSRFPFAEFIGYGENHGFGKAYNLGWESVKEEWGLILNNDCLLLNDAITKTLDAAKKQNADFATCALFNEDGSPQANFTVSQTPFNRIVFLLTGLNRIVQKFQLKLPKARAGFISGSCLMIQTELFTEAGGFDENIFMYAEDLDLMFKLEKIGARGWFFPAGKMAHLHGHSANRKWSKEQIEIRTAREVLRVMRKYFPEWKIKIWLTVQVAVEAVVDTFTSGRYFFSGGRFGKLGKEEQKGK